MKLHHYAHSSASYRVRIALALKRIDVEYVTVDMPNREQQSAAYEALNPQSLVPCLELETGSVLGQSIAIVDYLDSLQPTPALSRITHQPSAAAADPLAVAGRTPASRFNIV